MSKRNQTLGGFIPKLSKFILALSLAAPAVSVAQSGMAIYSNALVNGWQNWGWATLNYANTSPVYSNCTDSISVTISGAWQGIQLWHSDLTDASDVSISFWLNGGASGGQNLQMYGLLDANGSQNSAQSARYYLSTPPANTWVQYVVPLSSLGVANAANFTGFVIQDAAGTSEPTFYLDQIQLNSAGPLAASAGSPQTICLDSSAAIGGSPTATAGNAPYTYSWSPATGLSSATAANPTASPTSTTTYTVTVTDSTEATAQSSVTVTVSPNTAPTASAGGNQTISSGSNTAGLGGVVGGGATGGIWTTSGSGTFLPNATTLNATYAPSAGDISAGTVTLTLTSTGQNSACGAAMAQVVVSIQSTTMIYTNSLVNGWGNSSYNTTVNLANTSTVYTGCTDSISATITSGFGAVQLSHAALTNTAYTSIGFLLNGGASGGQNLQMYGTLAGVAQSSYALSTPPANTWVQYWVPLSALGVANVTDFTGFAIQDSANTAEPTFYLDNIQLSSATAPPLMLLSVNASQPIRTADARWFGLNTAVWDGDLDTPQTIALLASMGTKSLRLPGGSDSDVYHWLTGSVGGYSAVSLANFIQVVTNAGAQSMITLNYGTGTSNEAAAWVAYVNATTGNAQSLGVDANGFNWGTAGRWAALRGAAPLATDDGSNLIRISRTAPLNFKYWEIGNEVYGSWETDNNTVSHDPYTYAVRASGYMALIRAVDPTVKIGVVVETGEDNYANNNNHPVVNPVTGVTHNGWTPVLLATLKSLGATPDFVIFHNYPYNPGGESDAGLLASSGPPNGWASDAANLRMMITDYMGASIGTNIELVCTENNSVSSSPGKQSVSIVDGLYKMDTLAQLMQTEFNGLYWWDLRNGVGSGNDSSSLYGWRMYGDYGVVNGFDIPYPTFFTTVLMTDFVQTGDTVVTAASGYSLLSVYAARRQDGSLTVLAINKDPVNTLNGQVSVAGFTPASGGTVYSYGIPQDNAAENGTSGTNVAQTTISITGTSISYSFPNYSATVLALSPAPAALLPISQAAGQLVFQIQGQAGVPYVVQSSTDLITWTSISTNTSLASTINITNSVSPSQPEEFWRVIWQP